MEVISILNKECFTGEDANGIIGYFANIGIKTSYFDVRSTNQPRRFIFTTQNASKCPNNKLVDECNGVIVSEDPEWKLVSIPPPFVKPQYDETEVTANLIKQNYRIFEVEDGTLITLYYWQNGWRISTRNGVDVSNQRRYVKTFREMLDEILVKNNVTLDDLDKEMSHSFIIKHPELHYFYEGKDPIYRITFVQSVDLSLKRGIVLAPPVKGINAQKDVTKRVIKNPVMSVDGKETMEDVIEHVKNVKSLTFIAQNALDWYHQHGTVCYGFTLRSVNTDETKGNGSIIIESSLMKKIKSLTYDVRIPWQFPAPYVFALRAFLSGSRQLFISLFPQFKQEYVRFDEMLNKIKMTIIDLSQEKPTKENKILSNVSRWFLEKITQKTKDNVKAVAKDFITNVDFLMKHVDVYEEMIHSK